jgi:hypothetical protein
MTTKKTDRHTYTHKSKDGPNKCNLYTKRERERERGRHTIQIKEKEKEKEKEKDVLFRFKKKQEIDFFLCTV